ALSQIAAGRIATLDAQMQLQNAQSINFVQVQTQQSSPNQSTPTTQQENENKSSAQNQIPTSSSSQNIVGQTTSTSIITQSTSISPNEHLQITALNTLSIFVHVVTLWCDAHKMERSLRGSSIGLSAEIYFNQVKSSVLALKKIKKQQKKLQNEEEEEDNISRDAGVRARKHVKERIERGVMLFNRKHKRGLIFLMRHGIYPNTAKGAAQFLHDQVAILSP
ncbi:MAG: hypothetical protein EZS28_054792, partial [Streblomastix strix]